MRSGLCSRSSGVAASDLFRTPGAFHDQHVHVDSSGTDCSWIRLCTRQLRRNRRLAPPHCPANNALLDTRLDSDQIELHQLRSELSVHPRCACLVRARQFMARRPIPDVLGTDLLRWHLLGKSSLSPAPLIAI